MNKESFLSLLRDSSRTAKFVKSLEEESEKYPYSQPLRAMLARGSKSGDPQKNKINVAMAALYAADRSVLKDYMEKGRIVTKKTTKKLKIRDSKVIKVKSPLVKKPVAIATKAAEPLKEKKALKIPKKETIPEEIHVKTSIEILRAEVFDNLDELIKNKKALAAIIDSPKTQPEFSDTEKRKTPVKVKNKEGAVKKPKKKAQKKNSEPINESKEQLISRFIEVSPTITPNRTYSGIQEDLSAKSVAFNEDLISENLAEIFAKQGKIKKAIEIYKKLIWKFPQKKAFFAARIEEFKPN